MSIVSNLIDQSLANHGYSSYSRYAAPVVADLERALDSAVESIKASASRAGVSDSDVAEALISAGLVERPAPEPTPVADSSSGEGDLVGAVRDLIGKIDGLTSFARQHGFRG